MLRLTLVLELAVLDSTGTPNPCYIPSVKIRVSEDLRDSLPAQIEHKLVKRGFQVRLNAAPLPSIQPARL